MTPIASWHLDSPHVRSGPIAILAVEGDCDNILNLLGIERVGIGSVALREIPGIDQCVVARWTSDRMHMMPHGGIAVRSLFAARLASIGMREREPASDQHPVAALRVDRARFDEVLTQALARAASPLAIDLLLDQWRRLDEGVAEVDREHALALSRLIVPPLVVAFGQPNIGKSTLANALAGREVSLVADQPGTTRDHVGFLLNVGGLVVRYVDAPGVSLHGGGADPHDRIEAEAIRLVGPLLERADLVLWCSDARANPDDSQSLLHFGRGGECRGRVMRVRLRADLAPEGTAPMVTAAQIGRSMSVSARTGEGIDGLAASIRQSLVEDEALRSPGLWPFWRVPA